jgi:SAM-dependent methyltransferase
LTYEYERDTRQAYRSLQKARAYKNFHTRVLNWARFSTWREQIIVRNALAGCKLPPQAKILDIPCGTGILAEMFGRLTNPVVAADISLEMMHLARQEYEFPHFLGFVQSDITQTPFCPGDFTCIVTLGLMHRLPEEIRNQVLAAIVSLRPRYIIISYSLDSPWERFKQRLLKKLKPSHGSAPAPAPYGDIAREVKAAGLKILHIYHAAPLLSAEIVLVLEKRSYTKLPS